MLLGIMSELPEKDWNRPTAYPVWKVKDIFSHMIDTGMRRLSAQRDGHFDTGRKPDNETPDALANYIVSIADEWAEATRRVSPRMLVSIFGLVKEELYAFMKGMDPFGEAVFAVAWAGEERSRVWFDNAREYTEHWLHHQQICDALGLPGLADKKYLGPALDVLIRAVPAAYRDVRADEGACVRIDIEGAMVDSFTLRRLQGRWELFRGACGPWAARVTVDAMTACRLFTNMTGREERLVKISGDRELGRRFLSTLSIMA
jgi:uncharacterized protein (TIGR03083 family)